MVSKVQRRERTNFPKRYKIKLDKSKFEGEVENISASGIAVKAPPDSLFKIENDQFAELQIESIGIVSGRIARTYENGFAIAFDANEEQKGKIADEIEKFRRATARRKF